MLGRILLVALAVDVALAWVVLQVRLLFVQLVWFALSGHLLGGAEPSTVSRQLERLVAAQRFTWLGTAVLFLLWVHRAHRHLGAARVTQAADPGGTLQAFLTPGSYLLRAPRAVAALWRLGEPTSPPGAVDRWVAWWWGLCLASVAVDLATALLGRGLRGLVGFDGGLGLLTLGEGLRIAAAILTVVSVSRAERGLRRLPGARVPDPSE